jgi:metal-responsive CopG/Arc/MetJ family transcriptional regulator
LSYTNTDSRTGKKTLRKSPVVSFDIDVEFLERIDELAKSVGMSRSELVNRCILLGIHDYRREHGLE